MSALGFKNGVWTPEQFEADVARIERQRRALPRSLAELDRLIDAQCERLAVYFEQGDTHAAGIARHQLRQKRAYRSKLVRLGVRA